MASIGKKLVQNIEIINFIATFNAKLTAFRKKNTLYLIFKRNADDIIYHDESIFAKCLLFKVL